MVIINFGSGDAFSLCSVCVESDLERSLSTTACYIEIQIDISQTDGHLTSNEYIQWKETHHLSFRAIDLIIKLIFLKVFSPTNIKLEPVFL